MLLKLPKLISKFSKSLFLINDILFSLFQSEHKHAKQLLIILKEIFSLLNNSIGNISGIFSNLFFVSIS